MPAYDAFIPTISGGSTEASPILGTFSAVEYRVLNPITSAEPNSFGLSFGVLEAFDSSGSVIPYFTSGQNKSTTPNRPLLTSTPSRP